MKKWLLFIALLLVLTLLAVYFLIPDSYGINRKTNFAVNAFVLTRQVMNINAPFWAQNRSDTNQAFQYKGHQFRVTDQQVNSLVIDIDGHSSQLNFIMPQYDSIEMNWQLRMPLPVNPVARVRGYMAAKSLGPVLDSLMVQMKAYCANAKKVYHRTVIESRVKDSILLFTSGETNGYPTTAYIYSLIDGLKAYTAQHKAGITGDPMLHVITEDSLHFLTKVALPVNKRLPNSGKISYKWMLGGGNILITDVEGGPWAIQQAFAALDTYVHDHQRVAPAIPFESLTTNRLLEPDTSKWKTRIYYPVM